MQEIRTKKLKPPKKKRKTKAKENTTVEGADSPLADSITAKETISDLVTDDEVPHDNNIEVVEGLKSSSDVLAVIPQAADVMCKRRQNMPGYPK